MDTNLGDAVRRLVPREQISGRLEGEREQEEKHPGNPHGFPRRLVCAIEIDLGHMETDRDYHGTRSPMVEAPHKRAKRNFFLDEVDAVKGMVRSRGIIESQKGAGDGLRDKEKEGHASEDIN